MVTALVAVFCISPRGEAKEVKGAGGPAEKDEGGTAAGKVHGARVWATSWPE